MLAFKEYITEVVIGSGKDELTPEMARKMITKVFKTDKENFYLNWGGSTLDVEGFDTVKIEPDIETMTSLGFAAFLSSMRKRIRQNLPPKLLNNLKYISKLQVRFHAGPHVVNTIKQLDAQLGRKVTPRDIKKGSQTEQLIKDEAMHNLEKDLIEVIKKLPSKIRDHAQMPYGQYMEDAIKALDIIGTFFIISIDRRGKIPYNVMVEATLKLKNRTHGSDEGSMLDIVGRLIRDKYHT